MATTSTILQVLSRVKRESDGNGVSWYIFGGLMGVGAAVGLIIFTAWYCNRVRSAGKRFKLPSIILTSEDGETRVLQAKGASYNAHYDVEVTVMDYVQRSRQQSRTEMMDTKVFDSDLRQFMASRVRRDFLGLDEELNEKNSCRTAIKKRQELINRWLTFQDKTSTNNTPSMKVKTRPISVHSMRQMSPISSSSTGANASSVSGDSMRSHNPNGLKKVRKVFRNNSISDANSIPKSDLDKLRKVQSKAPSFTKAAANTIAMNKAVKKMQSQVPRNTSTAARWGKLRSDLVGKAQPKPVPNFIQLVQQARTGGPQVAFQPANLSNGMSAVQGMPIMTPVGGYMSSYGMVPVGGHGYAGPGIGHPVMSRNMVNSGYATQPLMYGSPVQYINTMPPEHANYLPQNGYIVETGETGCTDEMTMTSVEVRRSNWSTTTPRDVQLENVNPR